MQYLYADDMYHFMNTETYDQIDMTADQVGDSLKFVKENEMVKMLSHNGEVFAIEPPLFVELEITETEPGFKGDTAQGASKPAIVETGAQVSGPVPLPTKKEVVTILRAVHKYKDSREQFEQRTHKRLIDVLSPSQKTVDALSKLEMPAGVFINLKVMN